MPIVTRLLPWLAVAVGAAIGVSARYGADLLIPHAIDGVPWSTIIVNTVGSFALGFLAAGIWEVVPDWVRAGLGAGLLGSFTTFSSLMVAAIAIAQGGRLAHGPGSIEPGSLGEAAMVVVGSLFAGILAALIGIILGRRLRRRRLAGAGPTALDDREDA